jgi:predicted transcriptional regulator
MHAELEDAPELHRINSGLAGDEVKLITCTAGTTLCELLRLFVEERIHRVYVVKSECCKQAEAVITPTDIMRIVSGVW